MTEKLNIKQLKPISTDVNLGTSDALLPTQNAVKTYVDTADSGLQTQIDALSGRGRFLALWNCATGLAESNPPESPYLYKAGDYFVVGTVSSADPAVNYKPDGSSYTTGVASTTVETNEVSVNDTYFYDGTVWKLQSNAQKEVSFSALAGSPYDNTNLSNALNAKQNTLTAGVNISIENDIISSTAQESFFRGNFSTWENVPTNVNGYKENYKHEKTPTFGDFMVVADASDYVNPDFSDDPENVAFQRNPSAFTINIIVGNNTISVYYTEIQNNYKTIRELFTSKGYTGIGCEWLKLKYTPGSPGQWYITSTSNYYENNELVSANTDHLLMNTNEPTTNMFYLSRDAGVAPIALFGGWRFSYYGVWGTDGKNGWKPEYQVEDVLPIASPTEQGIAKLYTTTGNNIDGSMTQASITSALNNKVDKNADITGATHTKITYDNKGLVTTGADITLSDVTDITATAAEVNVLDGITATTTELNYVDGVTSSIQTQIDGKQATISDLATIRSGASAGATAVQPADLATVATTGDYTDLINKPTIPAAQVNSDWNANSGVAQILNKPTIPTVNNPTITITQNGSSVGSFTLNQASDDTIALTDTTYSVMTGASAGDAGASGLVPAPAAGDQAKFLQGDGTWANPTAATAWGNITGTLSDQTDLQNALNAKADDNAVVHLAGDETITGDKTFKGVSAYFQSSGSTTYKGFLRKNAAGDLIVGIHNSDNSAWQNYITFYTSNYTRVFGSYLQAPNSDTNGSVVTTVDKSKGSGGFFKLGNGLIVQWGLVNATSSGVETTLPTAFSSATSYRVVACREANNATMYVSVVRTSATKIKVYTSNATAYGIAWIAIGY